MMRSCQSSALRRAYEYHATEQGIRHTLGPNEFNRRLEARGCRRVSKRYVNEVGTEKIGKVWAGIALQEQPQEEVL